MANPPGEEARQTVGQAEGHTHWEDEVAIHSWRNRLNRYVVLGRKIFHRTLREVTTKFTAILEASGGEPTKQGRRLALILHAYLLKIMRNSAFRNYVDTNINKSKHRIELCNFKREESMFVDVIAEISVDMVEWITPKDYANEKLTETELGKVVTGQDTFWHSDDRIVLHVVFKLSGLHGGDYVE